MNHSKCAIHLRHCKVVKSNVRADFHWRSIRTTEAFEPETVKVLIEFEPSDASVHTDFAKSERTLKC
jgi:hypothetical protein